jgi:hypothetical protein
LGCGAHLDRADQRYQRKQARVVRRADLPVVRAAAVGAHACVVLLLAAALVQAVPGVPEGRAEQVPPVAPPVGAVLGVFLVPVGRREHAEPAGVAVPALPSVGHAILISEHAAAFDADAVVGVPIPYDRRHAATSGLYLAPATGRTDLWDNPPPLGSTHGRGSVELTAVASTAEAYSGIRAPPSASYGSIPPSRLPTLLELVLELPT